MGEYATCIIGLGRMDSPGHWAPSEESQDAHILPPDASAVWLHVTDSISRGPPHIWWL